MDGLDFGSMMGSMADPGVDWGSPSDVSVNPTQLDMSALGGTGDLTPLQGFGNVAGLDTAGPSAPGKGPDYHAILSAIASMDGSPPGGGKGPDLSPSPFPTPAGNVMTSRLGQMAPATPSFPFGR